MLLVGIESKRRDKTLHQGKMLDPQFSTYLVSSSHISSSGVRPGESQDRVKGIN